MKAVRIKKGWQFKIAGQPSQRIFYRPAGSCLAAVPHILPFIKPRLQVKEGDSVQIGSVLFEDKKLSSLKFLSPGCGTISGISYGPRRVIKEIVIKLDGDETFVAFEKFTKPLLDQIERKILISHLMNGGLWPFIRQLPFRQIADPDSAPNAIWVSLGSADPFQARANVYLNGRMDFFEFGIKALQRLSDTVNICRYKDTSEQKELAENLATHRISGKYPASDPGVILYHTKKTAAENHDWYIDGQDVALIGEFLQTGRYPVDRFVSLSDGTSENSFHIHTRIGVRLNDLTEALDHEIDKRWIVGGILSGYSSAGNEFLGLHQTSVMIIDESSESELFGFATPGYKKLSNSRTVLSALSSKPLTVNSDMHGELRPCVNCGYCANICPVDIMPQYTYKSLDADEIEEALALGLLDCVECGLCSFVCPSKIDLSDYLIDARHRYYKELDQVV